MLVVSLLVFFFSSFSVLQAKSLPAMIQPVADLISNQVLGNLSTAHEILLKQPPISASVRHTFMAQLHHRFQQQIPKILKTNVQSLLLKRKGNVHQDIQLAKKQTLLAVQQLQAHLFEIAYEEAVEKEKR